MQQTSAVAISGTTLGEIQFRMSGGPPRAAAAEEAEEHRAEAVGLEERDDQDDDRLDQERYFERDAAGEDHRRGGLDDQGAEDGAGERVAAAGEGGAADQDREDRVEFQVEAGAVGVGGA